MLTKPHPYQRKGARMIHRFRGRTLLADEMGLGKSLISLLYAHKKPDARPIIIICPAGLKYNWERECKIHFGMRAEIIEGMRVPSRGLRTPHQVIIINYDILKPWLKYLRRLRPKLIIVDECFGYDSLVVTDRGQMKIGDIVENKLPVKALSLNHQTGELDFCCVTHYIKKTRDTRMVKVLHEFGVLECTENHKVWTENRGYVKALELTSNDFLCCVSKEDELGAQSSEDKKILQQDMHVEKSVAGRGHSGIKERGRQTGRLNTNAGEQSNVLQTQCQQDERYEGNQRDASYGTSTERGQRTLDLAADQTQKVIGAEMDSGVCNYHPNDQSISTSLQSGPRETPIQSCDRDRWANAQDTQTPKEGQEKNTSSRISRVGSIEISEQGNRRDFGGRYKDNRTVYCLEVEGNHNFFADDVLVHNCHYIMNRNAKRTKNVRILCRRVPRVIMVGGTPLTNRPAEMFPALNILRPDLFPSFFAYATRYCGPKHRPWGWEFKGATNLDELHAILLKTCMIRRRKQDVLKDLPKKSRFVVPLEISNRKEYIFALKNFMGWLRKTHRSKALKASRAEQLTKVGYLKRLIGKLKLKAVVEWIDNYLAESDDKLLVFGVHKAVLRPLAAHYGRRCVLVDGKVKGRARQKAYDRFNADKKVRLLFGNMKAAGVGWNAKAHSVAKIELGWTPGEHTQAEDRCWGLGRGVKGVPTSIYYLIAKSTIEESLCKLIQQKQVILSETLDGKGSGDDLNVFDLLMKELTKKARAAA